MKNIQVIDADLNCTYDVFAANEQDFGLIFPEPGQDIEFINDFIERAGDEVADEVCGRLWKNRMEKSDVAGIHRTLLFELDHKKKFYPTKKAPEMVAALESSCSGSPLHPLLPAPTSPPLAPAPARNARATRFTVREA